jgi:uncharacterized repeat protein (TIGR01451 family)
MRRPILATLAAILAVAGAYVVFAQLTDTQTASGSVTATSTSADLYICEPESTPGPDCGNDDDGADESIFEGLEDIRPGETVSYDIRLKNVGTVDLTVTEATLTISETVDPGADCPDNALPAGFNSFNHPSPPELHSGVYILGKNGDAQNDNQKSPTVLRFRPWSNSPSDYFNINVAAGDHEDVRLALSLQGSSTEFCDGNEWNVSWQFTVG